MLSEESRKELIEKIGKANEILEDYAVQLQYVQYSIASAGRPLEPGLFCKVNNFREVKEKTARISLQTIERENGVKDLVFYLSAVNFETKDMNESKSMMDIVSKALNDIQKLNELKLWCSHDLLNLYF